MAKWIILMLVMITVLGGCREQDNARYVEMTSRIFVFNVRVAEASYLVTLKVLRTIPEGASVIASFTNPDGGEAIIVEQKIWPKRDKIVLESPALSCVKKDKPYPYDIKILRPNGEILQVLAGVITSTLDQTILPDRPLFVGPGYEPNPELSGRADGKIDWPTKSPCL